MARVWADGGDYFLIGRGLEITGVVNVAGRREKGSSNLAFLATTPWELMLRGVFPKVARGEQPWAMWLNAFGVPRRWLGRTDPEWGALAAKKLAELSSGCSASRAIWPWAWVFKSRLRKTWGNSEIHGNRLKCIFGDLGLE